jgi:hypothetical protein
MTPDLQPTSTRFELTTTVTPVAPANLPAVIPEKTSSRALVIVDKMSSAIPRTAAVTLAGGAWLTGLVAQCLTGGSSIVLASIVATGVLGGAALLPRLKAASSQPDPVHASKATSEAATQALRAHYNYIFDSNLTPSQRMDHAHTYAEAVSAIEAGDACKILQALSTGTLWGLEKPKLWIWAALSLAGKQAGTIHEGVLQQLGLGPWARSNWCPCDIEVVFHLLPKVTSASAAEKTDLEAAATPLLTSFHKQSTYDEKYKADLLAGARELIRRIPESGSAVSRA